MLSVVNTCMSTQKIGTREVLNSENYEQSSFCSKTSGSHEHFSSAWQDCKYSHREPVLYVN